VAVKITRASERKEAALELGTWFIAALSPDGKRVSHYPFQQLTAVKQLRDDPSAFLLYLHGRPRLYATPERGELMRLLSGHLTRLGLTSVISDTPSSTSDYRGERLAVGNDGAPRVAEFEVLKRTPRWPTPRTRKMTVTVRWWLLPLPL
jgi:hypothetical protein